MFIVNKRFVIFFVATQPIITACLLRYTSKLSSLRAFNLLAILMLVYIGCTTRQEINGLAISYQLLGGAAATIFLHSVQLLYILKADVTDLTHIQRLRKHPVSQFGIALLLASDPRAIGTRWEPKNLPALAPCFRSSDSPRPLFLLRNTVIFLWKYLVLDVIVTLFGSEKSHGYRYYQHDLHFILNPFSTDWITRVAASLLMWPIMLRLTLDIQYTAISLILVGTGVCETGNWPPFFGSISDAYTIRKFWNTYWHQLLRWPLTSCSRFITRTVLRLPSPSWIERYLNILCAFFLSGLIHIFATSTVGMPKDEAGSIKFFSLFTVAIIIEDTVQAMYRRFTTNGSSQSKALWKRAVGYLWVLCCFSVNTPGFTYDLIHSYANTPSLLPFSFTKHLGEKVVIVLLLAGAATLKRVKVM
ncbi:membrane bound O-acyl transferase family-domain-containing protein [Aspergillus sergii]|uniref:Membrane bound O-acyl transferase family-domain-containing protein n=1 Tax=Aspergillus sergii TaxID=1034303 RepID=A0A5N6XAV7_9EURO|nr:membrane bound O-acyl transferase family-domain-containing protein [Aspergillus sergii]